MNPALRLRHIFSATWSKHGPIIVSTSVGVLIGISIEMAHSRMKEHTAEVQADIAGVTCATEETQRETARLNAEAARFEHETLKLRMDYVFLEAERDSLQKSNVQEQDGGAR